MTQEVLKFTKAITEPNTITFHNSNADWVMRITADRRIEVNEDVEVTEAAQKVLDAMQYLLKAQTQEPVSNDPLPRACNLAGVDYQTFLKIKAYMPITPPQRKPLTDEEIEDLYFDKFSMSKLKAFARAIEAAHGIKENT